METSHPGVALQVDGLGRSYGRDIVLNNLSFSLPGGSTLSVIGPSGCGKSTLLYLLAGLDAPQAGSIRYLTLSGSSPRIAFILQDYGLFPWKTVEANIALPLELTGMRSADRRKAVASMLAELHLQGLSARYPSELSGGQRQRVAIGRDLIAKPDVLLMDEPFSSLDALTREHLQQTVLALWKRHRLTCVLVTHDVGEAAFLGQYVMVLGGAPARTLLWMKNTCFGDSDCRNRKDYFEVTRRIHAALAAGSAEGEGDAACGP